MKTRLSLFASPDFAAACVTASVTLAAILLGGALFQEAVQQRSEVRQLATQITRQVGLAQYQSQRLVIAASTLPLPDRSLQGPSRRRAAQAVDDFNAALENATIEVGAIMSQLAMNVESKSPVANRSLELRQVVEYLYECASKNFSAAALGGHTSPSACQPELERVKATMDAFNDDIKTATEQSQKRVRRWMLACILGLLCIYMLLIISIRREPRSI